MRFRNTLLVAILFVALGAYLWFVEREKIQEEEARAELFPAEVDDVTGIRLERPNLVIEAHRDDEGWRIVEPLEDRGDATAIENLIRAVVDAEVKRRIEEEPDSLEPFGLDEPTAVVKLTLGDGKKLPAVRVGKIAPVGGSTFVAVEGETGVVLAPAALASGVKKELKDLRSKQVVSFETDAIERVEIVEGDATLRIVREDAAWQIVEPRELDADPAEMRTFLSSLSGLRAEDFVDDADLDAAGLEPPARRILLGEADGGPTHEIRVGGEAPGEKGLYVQRAGKDTVFVVASWATNNLTKGLDAFRDKTVLVFEPESVEEIRVDRREGESFRLVRREAEPAPTAAGEAAGRDEAAEGEEADETPAPDWKVVGHEERSRSDAVETLLADLHAFEGHEIVSENAADAIVYGLDRPDLVYTLVGEDGETIGEISIARREGDEATGEHYATSDASTVVYRVRSYLYTQLDKRLGDFLEPEASPPPAD